MSLLTRILMVISYKALKNLWVATQIHERSSKFWKITIFCWLSSSCVVLPMTRNQLDVTNWIHNIIRQITPKKPIVYQNIIFWKYKLYITVNTFGKSQHKNWCHLDMQTDMWHMTLDMWGEVNLFSKFQLPSSYGLGVKMFWRYFHQGSVTQ